MRIYYERWIVCTHCGQSQRQTSTTKSLDWIGKALDRMQRKDFIETHGSCESPVYYTPWKLGSIFKGKFY